MGQIMLTKLEIRQGCLAEFYEVMENVLIPLLDRNINQRLIAGYKTVVGGSNHEVTHIWEIEDANLVMTRSKTLSADPDFAEMIERLKGLVVHESFSLVAPTPYSPTLDTYVVADIAMSSDFI